MVSHYKKKDLLKIQSFYSSQIENNKKKKKKTKNIPRLSPPFKKLSNKQLLDILPLSSEKKKDLKDLLNIKY